VITCYVRAGREKKRWHNSKCACLHEDEAFNQEAGKQDPLMSCTTCQGRTVKNVEFAINFCRNT